MGVGSYLAVDPYDDGPSDSRPAVDDCALAYSDVVGYYGCLLYGFVAVVPQVVEDELVGLEEVIGSACVFLPALGLLDVHLGSVFQEGLDSVCDL